MIRTCFTSIRISIHAPREGGDEKRSHGWSRRWQFQSTPPARGATTGTGSGGFSPGTFQSSPPARGATMGQAPYQSSKAFQSTPPARGATIRLDGVLVLFSNFNPRPPRGGRRPYDTHSDRNYPISIHAPREGGDSKDAQFYLRIFDKQVELLRFLGKIRGGCLRNPEKDRRFLGKSLANLPAISGHLDFAGREGASRIPVRRTTAAPGGVCQRIRGSSGR